mgnify:CR=1 FL=1
MRRFLSYTFILCGFIAVCLCSSCKKNDAEETKPYMEGEVKFDFPSFVKASSTVTSEASGITKPEEHVYKWSCNSMFNDTVVSPVIIGEVPDSLGTYAITAFAFADGYYASYTTKMFTTVNPERNGSLKGIASPAGVFRDSRDDMDYDTVRVGSLYWFAQNLAWSGAGVAYGDSPITHSSFGRMYTWNEATGGESGSGLGNGPQGACPEGWSVPTAEDWEDLAAAVTGSPQLFSGRWPDAGVLLSAEASFNGSLMWPYSYDNRHTNDIGWNAIPTGYYNTSSKEFLKYGKYAFFWSSFADGDKAYYRYVYYNETAMPSAFTSKEGWAAPVRCVKPVTQQDIQ